MFTTAVSTTFVPPLKVKKRIMIFYTPTDAWGAELLFGSGSDGTRSLTGEFGLAFRGAKDACVGSLQQSRLSMNDYAECLHGFLSRVIAVGFTAFRGIAAMVDAPQAQGYSRPGHTSATGHIFIDSLSFEDIDRERPERPYLREIRILLVVYCPVAIPL